MPPYCSAPACFVILSLFLYSLWTHMDSYTALGLAGPPGDTKSLKMLVSEKFVFMRLLIHLLPHSASGKTPNGLGRRSDIIIMRVSHPTHPTIADVWNSWISVSGPTFFWDPTPAYSCTYSRTRVLLCKPSLFYTYYNRKNIKIILNQFDEPWCNTS